MKQLNKFKKPLLIVGIVLGVLILGAVVVGILNATVGGGEWSLGWSDYRYDESDYQVGSGTIPAPGVTSIDVDWIDGNVQIVLCDDAYLSVTESSESLLTEDSLLRWKVSEDGKSLSLKYRKSSWFLGASQNKNKDLILRIPRKLIASLESLTVQAVSANVTLNDVVAKQMTLKSKTGNVTVSTKSTLQGLRIEGESGDIKLILPYESGFSLGYQADRGDLTLDFPNVREGERYVYRVENAPMAEIDVQSKRGKLTVTYED